MNTIVDIQLSCKLNNVSIFCCLFSLQHMRSHEDPEALSHPFYDVISANSQSPRVLRELRRRCLNPGLYAQHLERWLNYYDVTQVN